MHYFSYREHIFKHFPEQPRTAVSEAMEYWWKLEAEKIITFNKYLMT